MSKSEAHTTSSPEEPVSFTVVRAVAEANGVDPMDLEERLHDCVDPDALDQLFGSGAQKQPVNGRLSFSMAGCRVEVDGSGRVVATQMFDESPAPDTIAP